MMSLIQILWFIQHPYYVNLPIVALPKQVVKYYSIFLGHELTQSTSTMKPPPFDALPLEHERFPFLQIIMDMFLQASLKT